MRLIILGSKYIMRHWMDETPWHAGSKLWPRAPNINSKRKTNKTRGRCYHLLTRIYDTCRIYVTRHVFSTLRINVFITNKSHHKLSLSLSISHHDICISCITNILLFLVLLYIYGPVFVRKWLFWYWFLVTRKYLNTKIIIRFRMYNSRLLGISTVFWSHKIILYDY